MDIVMRIIEFLNKNRVTGVEVGKLLGLSKSPLTDWKNGKSKPTLEQVAIICENFAVSADFILFGRKDGMSQAHANISCGETELIENYRKLDNRGKHKLHTIIYEELDRKRGDEEAPRPIPFAASGEADITPENYEKIQVMLQNFEKRAKELNRG